MLLKGIPVSPGIAYGKVVFLEGFTQNIPMETISEKEITSELSRFDTALSMAKRELKAITKRIKSEIGEEPSNIFRFQSVMLEDPAFITEIRSEVSIRHLRLESAISRVIEKYRKMFFAIEDVYLRGRSSDIVDVGNRLLTILTSREDILNIERQKEKGILFGMEFFPSDLVKFKRQNILGLISEIGGVTSHASLIARSMNTPAVVAVKNASRIIKPGDILLVNAYDGTVFVNPDEQTTRKFEGIKHKFAAYLYEIDKNVSLAAKTQDGYKIKLMANVDEVGSIEKALDFGAEGIGLYRMEYFYLKRDSFPTSRELISDFKSIAAILKDKEMIVRVTDIGGDKEFPYLELPKEYNPALGMRGMRVLLHHRHLFETQIKSILKASAFGKFHILFPMVSTMDEVKKIRQIIHKIKNELKQERIFFDKNIKFGIMIETPSAAMNIESFLPYIDFISIGTNDLVQYILAVDRANPQVAKMYEPLDYSVLSVLKKVIQAGKEFHKDVSICGEIAANPNYTLILLGLGLEIFSVPPMYIPIIKEIIRKTTYQRAHEITEHALTMHDTGKIKKLLSAETKILVPYIEKMMPL